MGSSWFSIFRKPYRARTTGRHTGLVKSKEYRPRLTVPVFCTELNG